MPSKTSPEVLFEHLFEQYITRVASLQVSADPSTARLFGRLLKEAKSAPGRTLLRAELAPNSVRPEGLANDFREN